MLDDARRLPYAEHSFDAVVSMDVIEHVPEPLPWVKEALRVLRPRGRAVPDHAQLWFPLAAVDRKYRARSGRTLAAFQPQTPASDQNEQGAIDERARRRGVQTLSVESIAFDWVLTAYGRKS